MHVLLRISTKLPHLLKLDLKMNLTKTHAHTKISVLKDNVTAIASRAGQIISHLTAEKSNTHGSPHIASLDVDAAKQSLQNGSLDVRPSQSDSSPTAKGGRPTL